MTTLELARMFQNQRVSWNFLQPLKPFPYQVKGSCHEIKKTKCPWIFLSGYRVFKKLVKSLLSYISSSKQHQQTKLIHCNTPNLKFNKISAKKKIADDIKVANFTIFSNSEGKGKLEVVRVLPLSQEEEEPRQEQEPHLDIPFRNLVHEFKGISGPEICLWCLSRSFLTSQVISSSFRNQ